MDDNDNVKKLVSLERSRSPRQWRWPSPMTSKLPLHLSSRAFGLYSIRNFGSPRLRLLEEKKNYRMTWNNQPLCVWRIIGQPNVREIPDDLSICWLFEFAFAIGRTVSHLFKFVARRFLWFSFYHFKLRIVQTCSIGGSTWSSDVKWYIIPSSK